MKRLLYLFVMTAVLSLAAQPVQAQRQARTSRDAATLVAGLPDSAVLSELRFRSIGPAVMSGRIADISVPTPAAGERWGETIYVASSAGGVWKSTNAGVTWQPIFDAIRISSIGAVAVAPSDANVVYVGTGESNNLRSSSWGAGVYRSGDAGKTWTLAGLEKSQHIARLVVHPGDPNTVFVAAMGPLWAAGGERGFYKTTDGGKTWRNTKTLGPHTGMTDIALDPANPDIIYAASMQRDRRAYSFVAGGAESRIWKSTDAGETWTHLSQGLPAGDIGRIGIAVAPSQPNTLYATISGEGEASGIYRSDDAGATWRKTNSLWSIPWFFGQIRVDPKNAERVYHLGVQLSVSDDGGKTFRTIANQTHADHHAMWIDPSDPDHLLLGNDGGFYSSHDRGTTWDFALNLPVSTFYAIGADMREPDYWVYGGLQDNGTWGAPSRTRNRSGITNADWVRAGGGDGFYAAIDPQDPNIVYVESQNGALTRFDHATEERKSIRPPTAPGEQVRYNWSAPLLISPHDHRTLYFGANVLYKSTDRGDSWTKISGDLTRALNRDSLPIMGLTGPGGFGRHEGTAEFGNLSTIDESPRRAGLIYIGTDDGVVQVTRDGGATWTRIDRFPGVPDMTYVSRVVASAHNEGTVYVTLEGHRSNDFKPYVLRSDDYGRTFRSISSNLPADAAVYVIREHPAAANLLFVGTEYGVYVSTNGGAQWTQLKSGIAPAPVHDLLVHPRENDLVVGTHGRGMYILDDLAPLVALATRPVAEPRLFTARAATIQNLRSGPSIPGDRNYRGQNPPPGAQLSYFVPAGMPDSTVAVLEVLDQGGAVVRTLTADAKPGVHRVTWDLRHNPPVAAPPQPQQRGDDDGPQFGNQLAQGPYVLPGTYSVQLKLGRKGSERMVSQTTVAVRRDPLVRLTDAEFGDLHDVRLRTYSAQRAAGTLAADIDAAIARLDAAMKDRDTTSAAFAGARSLRSELNALLTELRGARRAPGAPTPPATQPAPKPPIVQRLNGISSSIGSAHFLPTAEQRQTLAEAAAELTRLEPRVREALIRVDAAIAAISR